MPLETKAHASDIHSKHTKDNEWKTFKEKIKEETEQIRNERNKEQFEYYIGLYEKFQSKDWNYIKLKLDEEKFTQKMLRLQQKKIEEENLFVTLTKKEMDGFRIGGHRDKW